MTDEAIGTRYFQERRTVVLVEVVEQRDEPPGRGDRTTKETTLAASTRRISPNQVASAIEEVCHS